ncbi:MAG: hypothetical protein AAFX04_12270 [Pseudomonadota bacterium]
MAQFQFGAASRMTVFLVREKLLSCFAHIGMLGVALIALITVFSAAFFRGWSVLSVIASQGSGLFDGPESQIGILLFSLCIVVVAIAATMSIFRSTASSEDVEFPQAFLYGYLACIPVTLTVMLAYIVMLLPLLPVFFLVGVSGPDTDLMAAGVIGISLMLVYGVMSLFIIARLGLAGPIMADRASVNPFSALAASWQLTRGHTLELILYYFCANLLITIVYYAAIWVLGQLGMATSTFLSGLLALPVLGVYLILMTLVPVGIYRLLAGVQDSGELEEVFA